MYRVVYWEHQSTVYSFATFDSFMSGLDRNQVYSACCSAQTAPKKVLISLAKQTTDARDGLL